VAYFLQPLEDRLVAILESNRGGAAPFSAAAQGRAVTAKTFRRSADKMPLLDPEYPGDRFDSAYQLDYLSLGSGPEAYGNPLDAVSLRELTLVLRIGFVYGVALYRYVARAPASQEDAAVAVVDADLRALSLVEKAVRAVTYPEIFTDTATDPALVDCTRVGPTTLEKNGSGQMIASTTLRIWLQMTNGSAYTP